jgi:hypothetical protein
MDQLDCKHNGVKGMRLYLCLGFAVLMCNMSAEVEARGRRGCASGNCGSPAYFGGFGANSYSVLPTWRAPVYSVAPAYSAGPTYIAQPTPSQGIPMTAFAPDSALAPESEGPNGTAPSDPALVEAATPARASTDSVISDAVTHVQLQSYEPRVYRGRIFRRRFR